MKTCFQRRSFGVARGDREVASSNLVTPTIDKLQDYAILYLVMPKAPEYTRKKQKQRDTQWAKEAHEKGAIQEFPGAPIWNDWLKEQYEAKKREVGFPRRIGRTALEIAAVSVLVAKELPRALTDERHKSNARKAQRLQRVVDRSNSAEAIPDTDLRKVEKSRLRRLGRGVMSALNSSNKKSLERTSQKAEHLSAKSKANRQDNMGPIEAWASNKLNRIDTKRQEKYLRRQKQFEAEKQVAWSKYLDENPEVKKRLIAEQEQRDKQFEIGSQSKRYSEMQGNASFATEYFVKRSAYSFSKAIPRRPDFQGSYDELAKSSVEHAAKNRQADDSISLLNRDLLFEMVEKKMPLSPDGVKRDGPVVFDGENHNTSQDFYNNDRQLFDDIRERCDYVGGVATSLWKMGFVEFNSETDIAGGGNRPGRRMNETIEWGQDQDTILASLAYDPENELHRIIAGDHVDSSDAKIQLAISGQQYAPEMSVRLVQQPALVSAA